MSGEDIALAPSDGFLIVNALRYAYTRSQITLDDTCWWVVSHWHELSARTRKVIANDVRLDVELRRDEPPEEAARHRTEAPHWEKLLDLAEKEKLCHE